MVLHLLSGSDGPLRHSLKLGQVLSRDPALRLQRMELDSTRRLPWFYTGLTSVGPFRKLDEVPPLDALHILVQLPADRLDLTGALSLRILVIRWRLLRWLPTPMRKPGQRSQPTQQLEELLLCEHAE